MKTFTGMVWGASVAATKDKKPLFVDEDKPMLEWFYDLDPVHFLFMVRQWNDRNLEIKLKRKKNYDDWLNYFKSMPASHIKILAATGQDLLPTEGYAALARWHDIINNPARIDKIHQSGLTNKKGKMAGSILALAQANDRLGVLKATRDSIAEKLEKGAGARDTAMLAREMTEVMTQISDYEKRLGPKKDTILGQLLEDMPTVKPRNKESGSRNTSFKSRVTIDDTEEQ